VAAAEDWVVAEAVFVGVPIVDGVMVRVRKPEDPEPELDWGLAAALDEEEGAEVGLAAALDDGADAELAAEVGLAAAALDEPAGPVVMKTPPPAEELLEPVSGGVTASVAPLGTQLVPLIGANLFEVPGFMTLGPGLGYVGSVDSSDLQSLISARFETISSGSSAPRVMSSVSLYDTSRLALPPLMVTGAQFM
jgi:hypothetical protein